MYYNWARGEPGIDVDYDRDCVLRDWNGWWDYECDQDVAFEDIHARQDIFSAECINLHKFLIELCVLMVIARTGEATFL